MFRGYYAWWAGAALVLAVVLTGCAGPSAPVAAPPTTWSSVTAPGRAVPMAGTAPSGVSRAAVPEMLRSVVPRLFSVDDATLLGLADSTCAAWARGADPHAVLLAGVSSGFSPLESHTIMSSATGMLCPQYNANVTYSATGFYPYN